VKKSLVLLEHINLSSEIKGQLMSDLLAFQVSPGLTESVSALLRCQTEENLLSNDFRQNMGEAIVGLHSELEQTSPSSPWFNLMHKTLSDLEQMIPDEKAVQLAEQIRCLDNLDLVEGKNVEKYNTGMEELASKLKSEIASKSVHENEVEIKILELLSSLKKSKVEPEVDLIKPFLNPEEMKLLSEPALKAKFVHLEKQLLLKIEKGQMDSFKALRLLTATRSALSSFDLNTGIIINKKLNSLVEIFSDPNKSIDLKNIKNELDEISGSVKSVNSNYDQGLIENILKNMLSQKDLSNKTQKKVQELLALFPLKNGEKTDVDQLASKTNSLIETCLKDNLSLGQQQNLELIIDASQRVTTDKVQSMSQIITELKSMAVVSYCDRILETIAEGKQSGAYTFNQLQELRELEQKLDPANSELEKASLKKQINSLKTSHSLPIIRNFLLPKINPFMKSVQAYLEKPTSKNLKTVSKRLEKVISFHQENSGKTVISNGSKSKVKKLDTEQEKLLASIEDLGTKIISLVKL